jgi:hypothetical protein
MDFIINLYLVLVVSVRTFDITVAMENVGELNKA